MIPSLDVLPALRSPSCPNNEKEIIRKKLGCGNPAIEPNVDWLGLGGIAGLVPFPVSTLALPFKESLALGPYSWNRRRLLLKLDFVRILVIPSGEMQDNRGPERGVCVYLTLSTREKGLMQHKIPIKRGSSAAYKQLWIYYIKKGVSRVFILVRSNKGEGWKRFGDILHRGNNFEFQESAVGKHLSCCYTATFPPLFHLSASGSCRIHRMRTTSAQYPFTLICVRTIEKGEETNTKQIAVVTRDKKKQFLRESRTEK